MRVILFLLFTLFAFPAQALIVPERPAQGLFIADTVNIISKSDETRLQNIAANLYLEKQIPIVVVTIDSLLNYTDGEYLGIEAYSKKLFKYWKIGHKSHNYGVLVLISRDDKIARIQFGNGWGFLYDKQAQKIMDKIMIPFFEKRQYSKGITAGIKELDALARTELKFLVDETKIAAFIFIFILLGGLMTHYLITNMHDEFMKHQKKSAIFPGLYFIAIYILYLVTFLNHIEFWLIFFISTLLLFLMLFVYAFFYAKTHPLSNTIIHTATVFIMICLMPLAIFVWHAMQPRNEYGDGSADAGGGATGSWE